VRKIKGSKLNEKLKRINKDRNLFELDKSLLESSYIKRGASWSDCVGLLDTKDNEYSLALKESRALFKKWNKSLITK